MALFRASADSDLPPERLWEALLDWEATREWMVPPTTVQVIGEQRTGIGTRLSAVTTIAGIFKLRDRMIVTDWDEHRLIRVRHVAWMVRGDGIFLVEPTQHGSRFTWIEDMPMPLGPVGEIAALMARGVVEWFVRRGCLRLVALAQRRAVSG